MVCVRNKKCEQVENGKRCEKNATHNIRGEKKPIYCWGHSDKDTMINIKMRLCIFKDDDGTECGDYAYYNKIGETTPLFCPKHKKDDMFITKYNYTLCVDCEHTVIPSVATHGLLFQPKTHCNKHHLPNEITNNFPTCEGNETNSRCKHLPYYTDPNDNIIPIRCEEHKLTTDQNIIEKPCENCRLPYFMKPESSLCENCDGSYQKYQKNKELAVKDLLNRNKIEYTTWDKTIPGGCSQKRPDFIIDKGSFIVFIEVDEKQHKYGYGDRRCELTRMIQLHQDAGLPCVFVRYNPDSYRDQDNKLIRSKNGREKVFIDILRGLSNRDPIKDAIKESLSAYYLYYDGYNGTPKRIEIDYIKHPMETIVANIFEHEQ